MARLRWSRELIFGVGGLAGFFACWLLGGGAIPGSSLRAQSGETAGGRDGGTIAFTTTSPDASQHLYLIDTRTQSFAIYRGGPEVG